MKEVGMVEDLKCNCVREVVVVMKVEVGEVVVRCCGWVVEDWDDRVRSRVVVWVLER